MAPKIEMSIFLVKYIPLIKEPAGCEAIKQYQTPPCVDGSCRREQDSHEFLGWASFVR
jgi:hypothetical protein